MADFNLFLGADNCSLKCRKNILKSHKNYQSYSKCYRGTVFIDSQFRVHDALNAFYKVVWQHNLGDVANSILHLCSDS